MLMPLSRVSAAIRPASNCACTNGCSEFFNVDCSPLPISPPMRGAASCAPEDGTIKEQAASRPHTHRNLCCEFAVIVFIAILLKWGRLKVEAQIPSKAVFNRYTAKGNDAGCRRQKTNCRRPATPADRLRVRGGPRYSSRVPPCDLTPLSLESCVAV